MILSRLESLKEANGKNIREAGVADIVGGFLDRVCDAPQRDQALIGIEDGVSCARVSISGLTHSSGVDQVHCVGLECDVRIAMASLDLSDGTGTPIFRKESALQMGVTEKGQGQPGAGKRRERFVDVRAAARPF